MLDHIESREVPDPQRLRMWQLLRPILSEPITLESTMDEVLTSQKVTKEKFLQMSPLFWMKVGAPDSYILDGVC